MTCATHSYRLDARQGGGVMFSCVRCGRRDTKVDPGWYLVGRLDGTIEPFFLRLFPDGKMDCGGVSGHAVHSRWWWEEIHIPDVLPERMPQKP